MDRSTDPTAILSQVDDTSTSSEVRAINDALNWLVEDSLRGRSAAYPQRLWTAVRQWGPSAVISGAALNAALISEVARRHNCAFEAALTSMFDHTAALLRSDPDAP